MTDRIHVQPAHLRQAAAHHQQTADYLRTVPSSHDAIRESLDSLGPIFSELRDTGRELLELRKQCYQHDAARLSGADFTLYRHNDMDHLARVLRRTEGRRRIIVVDAVFSMEGTVADLATIAELADRHGCRVYVDESHALGVLGPDGRGASAALGVLARMDVVMGTFSKSFASVGGFIAGDRPVVDYIRHNGSGHVFSASLPPAAAAATHAALRVSRREPDRRARVLAAAEYMATGLARQGYQAEYHGTAIVPVILGNPTVAHAGYLRLMRSGVYVNPVAPPAVPEERSGFRTSYLADHRQSDLDRALHVFAGLAEDLTPQGAAL